MKIIALEEHYWDDEVATHFKERGPEMRNPEMLQRLRDLDTMRIKEMDEAGIDLQIVSHGAPATQRIDAETAVPLAKRAHDRLFESIKKHPGRLKGFAVLPTANPKAAADELERAVTKLNFKGAMVHGLTAMDGANLFLDDKRFWPIFERAQALDVPLYMHPAVPHKAVIEAYYKDYLDQFPSLMTAAWGFGVEAATQGIRLVLSGVFDKYPKLKVILGHMGENLPFAAWRIDHSLGRRNSNYSFMDVFTDRFWITTSGFFSTPALLCSMQVMGADHILFSIDWPFVKNEPAMEWFDGVSLSAEDKEKIYGGNAKKLLKI